MSGNPTNQALAQSRGKFGLLNAHHAEKRLVSVTQVVKYADRGFWAYDVAVGVFTPKVLIGYVVLAIYVVSCLFFVYGFIRFLFVGFRSEKPRTNALTLSAFVAVIASLGLWFWAVHRFVNDVNWNFKERLTMGIGVGLCVVAIMLSRFSARRTSIPVLLGALVMALHWISSTILARN